MSNQPTTRRPPEWVIRAAHRRADESGIDHACMMLTGDIGMSDGRFAEWFAVPDLPAVSVCGLRIDITSEMWMNAPYVAIPGELQ